MSEGYQLLEEELQAWTGKENVVVCSSGTAALVLAIEALSLPIPSKILIPNLTMIACARAVSLAGHIPVFVDCTSDLLMDMDLVDRSCKYEEGLIRAVMPVHIYGRRCDMESLAQLAKKYDFHIIEDMAEAHGIPPHKDSIACYSFFKNKIVHGEEGGAVAFGWYGSEADKARQLRSLGFTPSHDFTHIPRGHNYRLANLLATPIRESLKKVHENLAERRQIEMLYNQYCPAEWKMPYRQVVWIYDLRIPKLTSTKQDYLILKLKMEGIQARHCFKQCTSQPEYCSYGSYRKVLKEVSISSVISREVLYLPVVPGVTTEEVVKKSFEIIKEVVKY